MWQTKISNYNVHCVKSLTYSVLHHLSASECMNLESNQNVARSSFSLIVSQTALLPPTPSTPTEQKSVLLLVSYETCRRFSVNLIRRTREAQTQTPKLWETTMDLGGAYSHLVPGINRVICQSFLPGAWDCQDFRSKVFVRDCCPFGLGQSSHWSGLPFMGRGEKEGGTWGQSHLSQPG